MKLIKFYILVILITVVSCEKNHPYGEQISIQLGNEKSTKFNFKALEKILLHPEVRNRKVVLLSIIGSYRKGKSFFLDYCLRYLYGNYRSINREYFTKKENWLGEPNEPLAGFSWKAGSKAHTKGILLWSDVFLHENDGENIAIILMDTQGLFELKRKALVDAKIFGISSFLSSIQILNLNDVIQENELEYLKMVTDFTKMAIKRQNEKSFESSVKPFQNLLFLVRDWSDEEVGFGYKGGQKYLETVFDTDSENDVNDQAKFVRNSIMNAYDNVDAFLLPSPGKIRYAAYDGSYQNIDMEFIEYLTIIIEELLSPEKLVTKKIFNVEVTANDLMNYASLIFLAYQSSDLPEIDSLFNIAAANEMNKLSDTVFENFTMNIAKCTYFEDENFLKRLSNDHIKFQKIALDEFMKTPKMGDESMENIYKESIIKKTDMFFLKWKPLAMKTHVDMINKKMSKLNAEKIAIKNRQEFLEAEQRLNDAKRQRAVQKETDRVMQTTSFRIGYGVCKFFSLGFAKCL